jgi:uncharacterized membrane protein YedE/YeeE
MHHGQLAWYVAGPVMGLCVVACRILFNGRLGVTGGFSEIVGRLAQGSARFDWRGWFALGIVAAGALSLVAFGGPTFDGYGWLADQLGTWVAGPVLVACGVLIGYGAKLSGGCTSGNGLSGTAQLSAPALAATGTFFATAIAISFLVEALT